VRVPVEGHLVGKPVSALEVEGKILVAGVSRGGTGFLPVAGSTMQEGDYLICMVEKDSMALLDEQIAAAEHGA
jgi:Trk K+ transport system NAD-binding subunit